MHFQLPENLKAQVVQYDPVLKPIYNAAKKQNSGKPAAPRMTLGLPDDLFPAEIISTEEQAKIAKELNLREANERIVVRDLGKVTILVAHHKSMWFALWTGNQQYVYGCTLAYKNTAATLARIPNIVLGWDRVNNSKSIYFDDLAPAQEVTYGRVKFLKHTLLVTEQTIISGVNKTITESQFGSYGSTTRHKHQGVTEWKNALKRSTKIWEDTPDIFARIKEQGDVRKCVFEDLHNYPNQKDLSLAQLLVLRSVGSPRSDNRRVYQILETPYFKKQINATVDRIINLYVDEETNQRRMVVRPYRELDHRLDRMREFLEIFPDATLDYCQQIFEISINFHAIARPHPAAAKWLQANMPITSFIQILNKELEKNKAQWDSSERSYLTAVHYTTGLPVASLHELNDTISMLGQLFKAQENVNQGITELQLVKPNRWRLTEFHDYISAEVFKIRTPNEKLHQDLFPEPIRVDVSEQRWSFFQPQDVHQLASWGRAVRNCVGSADSYRKGIKNKTHFIVLAMIDNQPRFTIQLKVRNGQMDVEQIADIANRRLTEDERESYTQAFGQALQIRSQQLVKAE